MKIYTKQEFTSLTRGEMYAALKELSPEDAAGKSRARKEDLIAAYHAALVVKAENGTLEETADETVNTDSPAPMVRANPEPEPLPEALQAHGLEYRFKGEPRALTERENFSLRRLAAAVAAFKNNPNTGHDEIRSRAYALNVAGIELPGLKELITQGRAALRDARRAAKTAVPA